MALTLNGSGSVAGLAAGVNGVGKVLQVVMGTYSTQTTTTSTSYSDTGLTATITPSSTTSKVLVFVQQAGCVKFSGSSIYSSMSLKLLKSGSDLLLIASEIAYNNTTNANYIGTQGCAYLDSPGTTSAVTYKTQFCSNQSGNEVRVQQGSAVSTMILLEVAA